MKNKDRFKKLFILLFGVFMLSCRQYNDNICPAGIDIHSGIECLYKKDIVEEIKYVALSANDDFLIPYINSIFFSDSLMFIVNLRQEVIFVYDLEGQPLYKIGSVGQGPGEYISLSNVIFDNTGHRIIISDVSSRKIITYDFSGNVTGEKRMPDLHLHYFASDPKSNRFVGERLDVTEDILIAFDDKNVITDSYLKINKAHQKVYEPYQSVLSESRFYVFNDTVFYLSLFDYAIYSYSEGNFKKEYCLNIPEKLKISSANREDNNVKAYDQIKNYEQQGLITDFSSFLVTDTYISFKIWGGDFRYYNILYDRKNGSSYFYEDLYAGNKDHGSPRLYQPALLSVYQDYFVFPIYYEQGLDYLRETVGMEIEEDSNPVLCFVKLKKKDDKN